MVAAADAVSVPGHRLYQSATVCTDTSLHSSSKRTRTSTGTTLLADSCIMDGATNSTHTIQTTGLTGSMEHVHVSDPGASSHGCRSRRSRVRSPVLDTELDFTNKCEELHTFAVKRYIIEIYDEKHMNGF